LTIDWLVNSLNKTTEQISYLLCNDLSSGKCWREQCCQEKPSSVTIIIIITIM